jgi:hypothetical protein
MVYFANSSEYGLLEEIRRILCCGPVHVPLLFQGGKGS